MRPRIDVAKSFERVDKPPVTQPPDYTDYPSGDVKTTSGIKVQGIISQEGLHKRALEKPVAPILVKPIAPIKQKIDVAKTWEAKCLAEQRAAVFSPNLRARAYDMKEKRWLGEPLDYTDYPSGEAKSKLISQEGLMKRGKDKLRERVPTGIDKPVKNVGILSAVDKFFNWLNKMLGD